MRDLNSIYAKLILILYPPKGGHNQLLRDWDLWGPLVICLALAIILSLDAPQDQSMQVFSLVISLITIGSVVVTVNSKLLGGKVSFFQSLVSGPLRIVSKCLSMLILCFSVCWVMQLHRY